MIVLIDGEKWNIWFEKVFRKVGKRTLIDTKCSIEKIGSFQIIIGFSYQNPLDRYDKITGKRIALIRALDQHPDFHSSIYVGQERKRRKSLRQEIWRCFMENFGHLLK